MQLENVNCQTQEQPFRFNFFLSSGEESSEIHTEAEHAANLAGSLTKSDTRRYIGKKLHDMKVGSVMSAQ